jgi:hypothetical protein
MEKLKLFFQESAFGVCSKLGEKLNFPIDSIRLFFIYSSWGSRGFWFTWITTPGFIRWAANFDIDEGAAIFTQLMEGRTDVVKAITAGFELGSAGRGIRIGFTVTAMRQFARSVEIAELAVRHRDAGLDPPTWLPLDQPDILGEVATPTMDRTLGGRPLVPTPAPGVPPVEQPDDQLIDLGEWLRAGQTPPTTRMTATAEIPPEGQQADFDEMLEKFKQGIAQNVDAEDYGSHYDLGIAFKEMGLVDEAIAEFQKALRSPEHRVATYEALGQCFVDKQQYDVAITLLSRALEEQGFEDEQGLGVLYLLGVANESLKRHADAAGFYQRVFALNTRFRDVADRLAAVT